MLVSIIMPAYNSEKTIKFSISSVLNQTYAEWQLIVCDDGSTDETKFVVNEFAKNDHRIRIVDNAHTKGPAGARNCAISHADGEVLAFLDSDDLWHTEKLERHMKSLKLEHINFTYSDYLCFKNQNYLPLYKISAPDVVNEARMKRGNPFGCLTVMIKNNRTTAKLFPEFSPKLNFFYRLLNLNVGHEDYQAWLFYLRNINFEGCLKIKGDLAMYRISSGSVSNNKFRSAIWHWLIFRNIFNLSFLSSLNSFRHYIFSASSRKKVEFDFDKIDFLR